MLDVLAGALRISTPYTLAAMGGVLSERAGVVNLALEGVLVVGALGYALAAHATGSPWLGLLSAMAFGVALMGIHAWLCVRLNANHIISGVGINLLAAGVGRFTLKLLYDSSSNGPRVVGFEETAWRHVQELPLLGAVADTPLVLLGVLVVPLCHFLLLRLPLGLRIRAVGEHPAAAESQGVGVRRVRVVAVLLGAVLASLGGAYLAADQHQFTQGMSAGRGFIAVAAVVFGRWWPTRAWLGCLVFGLAEAVQISMQSAQTAIPSQFVQMIPYVLTLAVLVVSSGTGRMPAALGRPFPEGAR
ncbi:MAG: ABC transporter permease [Myxococcota bacterium]